MKPNQHLPRVLIPVLVVPAAALLNAAANYTKIALYDGPFFFDSIFTIVSGIYFGWLPGMLTGLFTNVLMEWFSGFRGGYLEFAVVNMTTGLIAGLIAADKERYWTISRHIFMILALTIANAVLGTLIVNIFYSGLSGAALDVLVGALLMMGEGMILSTLLARIPINLVDKGLPVLIIFALHRGLVLWRSQKERR